MARKHFSTEQSIGMLREVEVRLSQGQTIGSICKGFGISEQSYYRWRRDYGRLKLDPAKRLIGQARSIQRWRPSVRDDEGRPTAAIIGLVTTYGRYG